MANKKKPLDGLFAQLQDIKDGSGKLRLTASSPSSRTSRMAPASC